MLHRFVYLLGFVFVMGLSSLKADPGMWPFDKIPVDTIERRYGLRLTLAQIEQMRASMLRVNNQGSGAFISRHGLLITNHHVAKSALRQITSKDRDIEKYGYTSKSREDEIKIPNYEINALIGIDDVTQRVMAAVKAGMSDHEASKARARVIAEIEEAYFKETGAKPQVISLFRGSVYHLYKFKRYRDVRLVWAPEEQAGFYGGDEEANFHYPRFALDLALFRIYDEDGEPVETPHYMPVSPYGSGEGDLLFIVGNPGSTKRHFSAAELLFEREVSVPTMIQILEDREAAMMAFLQTGEEGLRLGSSELFSIQNSLKVYRGMIKNFRENEVIEKKTAWEAQMRERLRVLGKEKDWDQSIVELESAQKAHTRLYDKTFSTGSLGVNSLFLTHAMDIVAIAAELKKDPLDRSSRYRESNRPSLDMSLNSSQPIYSALEEVKLRQSLSWLLKRLGQDHLTIEAVLRGKSVEMRAKELSESEVLRDPKKRKELFDAVESGQLKIEAIEEPWFQLAIQLRYLSERLEEELINEVSGPLAKAFSKILELRKAAGDIVYPDATMSPRFTYGVVKPYVDHGMMLPSYTTIGQAFDQAAARDNSGSWQMPESWMNAKARGSIDLATPYNFVSTHDTIGGNSGSPVIKIVNGKPVWVGAIFDGNRFASGQVTHSEPNAKVGRSVNVDCRALLAVLPGVYSAGYFFDEIQEAFKEAMK